MTPQIYWLLLVLGGPAVILAIAIAGAHFYCDGVEELLDWKPTRSARTEAELYVVDIQDMLEAVNRYRSLRGAPHRSLEDITQHSWANLAQYDESPSTRRDRWP